MILNYIIVFSVLAGIFQLLGYYLYINKTIKNDISPNPTTWLIFAFDTTLLVFLEAIAGASFYLLFLPFLCAIGASYIAWTIRKSGRLKWPADRIDSYILIMGIAIAAIYTLIFTLSYVDIFTTQQVVWAGLLFLILSNVNTFIAFVPILKDVYREPLQEHALPWFVWTIAYGLLAVATWYEVGTTQTHLILYVYPLSCLLLHALVAFFASDWKKS